MWGWAQWLLAGYPVLKAVSHVWVEARIDQPRQNAMVGLVARLSLVALLGFAMLSAGVWTGPAAAHDWFTGTRDPVTGVSCCGVSDCFELDPEDVQPTGDGGFRFRHPHTGSVWHTIEAARVQPSKTGRYAGCVWGVNSEAGPRTCGFAPSMF